MPNFTVVGAGVIGLTVALTIQETIKNAEVTIIAELTPEDPKNIRYTSQWAGAHQAATLTGPVPDPKQLHYDKETYRIALEKYKKDPSMPLLFLEHKQFFEFAQPEGSAARRMGEWLPDYAHFVDKDKLPQGSPRSLLRARSERLHELWCKLTICILGCLEGIVYKSFSYDTPNYVSPQREALAVGMRLTAHFPRGPTAAPLALEQVQSERRQVCPQNSFASRRGHHPNPCHRSTSRPHSLLRSRCERLSARHGHVPNTRPDCDRSSSVGQGGLHEEVDGQRLLVHHPPQVWGCHLGRHQRSGRRLALSST